MFSINNVYVVREKMMLSLVFVGGGGGVLPSQSGQVVCSTVLGTQTVRAEPPPMLADTSVSMWIEKAWVPS